jgi:pectin methylesterase-like acyl-CoA thioesterase
MIKKILAIATIFSISFSIDILVPTDYETVQEAVDAAINGDRIILDPGNYGENVVVENKDIVIGSKYLTTGDDFYILTTRIAGDSDKGASVTFKNTISNEAGLIGLTVNQNLIFGGC